MKTATITPEQSERFGHPTYAAGDSVDVETIHGGTEAAKVLEVTAYKASGWNYAVEFADGTIEEVPESILH